MKRENLIETEGKEVIKKHKYGGLSKGYKSQPEKAPNG